MDTVTQGVRLAAITRACTAIRALSTSRLTIEQLAECLDCHTRTARRYVAGIRAAGLPVRQQDGRYRIEAR